MNKNLRKSEKRNIEKTINKIKKNKKTKQKNLLRFEKIKKKSCKINGKSEKFNMIKNQKIRRSREK